MPHLYDIIAPYYDLDQIKVQNQEYIDKTSARISQLFNNMWLSRYPRPKQVVFDDGSEFKRDFILLLKDFDIKPVLTSIKNPQQASASGSKPYVSNQKFKQSNI